MSLEHTGNVKGNEEVYLIRYHKRMPTIPLHNASIWTHFLDKIWFFIHLHPVLRFHLEKKKKRKTHTQTNNNNNGYISVLAPCHKNGKISYLFFFLNV